METTPPPTQTSFFIAKLIEHILRTHVSYDKAFKTVVSRYGVSKWLLSTYYKIGYYATLYYYTLRWLAGVRGYGVTPAAIALFFRDIGFSVRRLQDIVERESKKLGLVKRISVKYSYPEYLVRDLLKYMEPRDLEKMLSSLNERRVWLRVNMLKTSVSDALSCLRSEGLDFVVDDKLRYMVRITKPKWIRVSGIKCVKEGLLIPQDIASAWVVEAIKRISENKEVLDACSAPGIKLGLLNMLAGFNRAIAVDVSWKRVNVLKKLSSIQGLALHKLLVINGDSSILKYGQLFNRALVDAPCSGSGAISSDPAIKISIWKKSKLDYYTSLQKRILMNILKASKYVVYSVCSIHPLEGEGVVEDIVAQRLAEPIDIGLDLPRGYSGFSVSKKTYRTIPHLMASQGFYIAVLGRVKK